MRSSRSTAVGGPLAMSLSPTPRPVAGRGRDPGRQSRFAVGRVGIDDHVLSAGGPQITRDLSPHPAEPAHDEVVAEGIDHLLYPALLEHAAELARDEELRHRRERVEERTYA